MRWHNHLCYSVWWVQIKHLFVSVWLWHMDYTHHVKRLLLFGSGQIVWKPATSSCDWSCFDLVLKFCSLQLHESLAMRVCLLLNTCVSLSFSFLWLSVVSSVSQASGSVSRCVFHEFNESIRVAGLHASHGPLTALRSQTTRFVLRSHLKLLEWSLNFSSA